MTHRFSYLLGVVLLLALASALADARSGARTVPGEKCRECAAYAPTSGVYAKPFLKEPTP